MIVFITLFIAVTIALAWQVLAPQLVERHVIFDVSPDSPRSFGSDMSWIAVKSEPQAVVEALGLVNPTAANWNCGIGTIYHPQLGQDRVFVSAPVDGWVFIAGISLPHPHGRSFVDKCTPLLTGLSERFGEVHYFASYPELDLFAWAKVVSGRVVRAFGISDDGVHWQRGRPTREERSLGLRLFELRGVRGRRGDAGGELLMHPTHEHVMRLAGQWGVNPTLLDTVAAQPGLGVIGHAPAQWRSERFRKTA
jgi:hypothetical protein